MDAGEMQIDAPVENSTLDGGSTESVQVGATEMQVDAPINSGATEGATAEPVQTVAAEMKLDAPVSSSIVVGASGESLQTAGEEMKVDSPTNSNARYDTMAESVQTAAGEMKVDDQIYSSAPDDASAGKDTQQTEAPRGMPKSGRWWKTIRKERTSGLIKVKPLKSTWKNKMKAKALSENVKKFQTEIREKREAEKAAMIEARKERERRREENIRKAEIVQVIRNTHKLKRAKKKQLRLIEKRDTN